MSTPTAGGDSESPPATGREALDEELELARVVHLAAAFAAAAVLAAVFYWGFRGVERRIAGRHPVLTEMLEELADPGWRLR